MMKRTLEFLKKNKLISIISLVLILICLRPLHVSAEIILQDNFTDLFEVDTASTTAVVDIVAGEVRLPAAPLPNIIALRKDSYEYAVATSQGEDYYVYDVQERKIVLNQKLSITDRPGVKGVAMRQDKYAIWLLTDTALYRYDLDKSTGTLINNSYLSATGMMGNISLSAYPNKDKVAVLSKSAQGKGIITMYQSTDVGALNVIPAQSFDTGLLNPVSVSLVPGTEDIIVAAGKDIHYYSFDKNEGIYKENSNLSYIGAQDISSIDGRQGGFGYLSGLGKNSRYYLYDKNSQSIKENISMGAVFTSNIVGLSMKPGAYEFAAVLEEGKICYLKFDAGSQSLKEIPDMGVTGLSIAGGYKSPAEYRTILIQTPKNFDEVKLTAAVSTPQGTSIAFYASSDGGAFWTTISQGVWVDVPQGNKFCLKAVLATNDTHVTPKILDLNVETTMLRIEDPGVIAITLKHEDQPVPTNVFPVRTKAGSQIVYTVDTGGYAEEVMAQFNTGEQYNMIQTHPINFENNTWTGTYTVMPDIPDGTTIDVIFTTRRGSKTKQLIVPVAFVLVDSTVVFDIEVRLNR